MLHLNEVCLTFRADREHFELAFSRVMAYRSIAQAEAAYNDFRTVLDRQSIFIPKSLADRLCVAGDLCPGAIAVRRAETEGRRPHNMMDDLVFRENAIRC